MSNELLELVEWLCENGWLPDMSTTAMLDLAHRFQADRYRRAMRSTPASESMHGYWVKQRLGK